MMTQSNNTARQTWCSVMWELKSLLVILAINIGILLVFYTTNKWIDYSDLNYIKETQENKEKNYSALARCYLDHSKLQPIKSKEQLESNNSEVNLPYLYWHPTGRLGNVMCEFASAFCIAIQTNHIPTISENSPLLNMFNIEVGVQRPKPTRDTKGFRIGERGCCYYQPEMLQRARQIPGVILLHGYRSSYKYSLPCDRLIRQEFTLNHLIQTQSWDYMKRALAAYLKYDHNFNSSSLESVNNPSKKDSPISAQKTSLDSYASVGVHVRRTDRRDTYAPLTFFHKAFQYYENKYDNVIFYVCSDDITWCKTKLKDLPSKNSPILFMSDITKNYKLDFAILMNCNHSIITAGTFSFWAGWLAKGEVVYHSGYDRWQSTNHSARYKSKDFYPADWIKMD